MAQRIVPADSDILCERCGYTLNHLPEENNCPECGEPIAHSRSQDGRSLSLYETDPRPATFWKTTFQVIFRTKRFHRTLKSRDDTAESKWFSFYHRIIAASFFFCTAWWHALWMLRSGVVNIPMNLLPWFVALAIPIYLMTHLLLWGVISLAQKLTALEARFWGIRLPEKVVKRAMRFHSANYLVVGLPAMALVQLNFQARALSDMVYLYSLCGLVIISAIYLFQTYWIGMKNLMYANR